MSDAIRRQQWPKKKKQTLGLCNGNELKFNSVSIFFFLSNQVTLYFPFRLFEDQILSSHLNPPAKIRFIYICSHTKVKLWSCWTHPELQRFVWKPHASHRSVILFFFFNLLSSMSTKEKKKHPTLVMFLNATGKENRDCASIMGLIRGQTWCELKPEQ